MIIKTIACFYTISDPMIKHTTEMLNSFSYY